jgi:hypothetical protein
MKETTGAPTLLCALVCLAATACSAEATDEHPTGSVAQALEPVPGSVEPGVYALESLETGGCLQVDGASAGNGANIVAPPPQGQRVCGAEANELWLFHPMRRGDYRLKPQHVHVEKCMRAAHGAEGGNVQQGRCLYLRSRWWAAPLPDGDNVIQLVSTKTGGCATVNPFDLTGNVMQAPCAGEQDAWLSAQLFVLTLPVGPAI